MFKSKYIVSVSIFITFLIITSSIKNKTRVIERQISNLNSKILLIEKNINEAQLDFHYLSSPKVIEKKLKILGFNNYQPIPYSKIYLDILDFNNIENKISNIQNLNEKEIQKK